MLPAPLWLHYQSDDRIIRLIAVSSSKRFLLKPIHLLGIVTNTDCKSLPYALSVPSTLNDPVNEN